MKAKIIAYIKTGSRNMRDEFLKARRHLRFQATLAVHTRLSPPRDSGDEAMIANDKEPATSKDRIEYFLKLLSQLRMTSRPEEFSLVAGGYRAEIEKMQCEALDYLTRHAKAG